MPRSYGEDPIPTSKPGQIPLGHPGCLGHAMDLLYFQAATVSKEWHFGNTEHPNSHFYIWTLHIAFIASKYSLLAAFLLIAVFVYLIMLHSIIYIAVRTE